MELRDLKSFVVLSESLHFGRAAERLFVTQSALSKQIQRLEAALGGALFERNATATRLTSLGKALYEEAKKLVESANRFERLAQKAAKGLVGSLRIGFGVSSNSIVPKAIAKFRAERPHVEIELLEMSAHHQIKALQEDALDIGFCRLPAPDGWPYIPLLKAHLVLVFPTLYPLAISLQQLVELPFAMIMRARAPAFYDFVMTYLNDNNIRISQLQTVTEFSAAIALAEAGVAWAIVPSSTPFDHSNIHVKPLNEADSTWVIGLIRKKDKHDVLAEAFWSVVEKM